MERERGIKIGERERKGGRGEGGEGERKRERGIKERKRDRRIEQRECEKEMFRIITGCFYSQFSPYVSSSGFKPHIKHINVFHKSIVRVVPNICKSVEHD